MPKHPAPSAYKEDYRDILTQHTPQQITAVLKLMAFLVFISVFFVYFIVAR